MLPREVPVAELPRRVTEVRDTWIPMPDGTRLAARMWLPEDAVSDPVPGILELLPYRKSDGTAVRDARNAAWLAGHGYAVVRVDIRGTGNSEGVILDEYTQQELDDGVACISWIAQQEWCTGRVGIMGISWGGFNGLQIAALRPPELHAVLSLCSTDDRYADDVHYQGGLLLADYQLPWATTMLAITSLPPEPEVWGDDWMDGWKRRLEDTPPFIKAWMDHQRRDEFWQHASVCEDPAAIDCPVFLVGGWADAYRGAIFRMLEDLEVPRRGLIGPWAHAWPNFARPGPQVGFLQEALRWWDRWLKDIGNGIDDEPMLRAWMQDSAPPRAHYDERPGRWIVDDSWPSATIETRPLVLSGGAAQFEEPPAAESSREIASVQSHGATGGRSCSYAKSYDLAVDQRPDDALAATFDSEPLAHRLELLGSARAELEISCDQPQGLVAVRLCDVAPDGASTLITRGILNLTHRDSHEHPQLLQPGTRYLVKFPLIAIGYAVPAGHRLRVAVAPTYWPIVWPSPEAIRLTLHLPRSRVLLPVRTGGADGPFPFPDAEYAQPSELEPLAGVSHGTVTRDLATGRVVIVNEDGGGHTRSEFGKTTRYYSMQRDTFGIADDDPTSATVAAYRCIDLSRDGWETRVVASGELTCDPESFHVQTQVTAYHEEEPVFERRWQFTFPRDLT